MLPDDPRRVLYLFAALAFVFGALCFGAPIAAWGFGWRRRASELEGALRAAVDREAIELTRVQMLEVRVDGMRRSLARTLGLLRR